MPRSVSIIRLCLMVFCVVLCHERVRALCLVLGYWEDHVSAQSHTRCLCGSGIDTVICMGCLCITPPLFEIRWWPDSPEYCTKRLNPGSDFKELYVPTLIDSCWPCCYPSPWATLKIDWARPVWHLYWSFPFSCTSSHVFFWKTRIHRCPFPKLIRIDICIDNNIGNVNIV